ncbi:MAG: ubiquitin-like domain-containing protein, partial [Chloroflexota bacterium]
MRRTLVLLALLLLPFQQQPQPSTVYLIEGDLIRTLPGGIPGLDELGLSPADRLLVDGIPYSPEQAIPPEAHTIQIRRAVTLTLSTPDGEQSFESAAYTVGEALSDLGLELYKSDFLWPPAGTPLTPGLDITYRPARTLTVSAGEASVQIRSSAETVGQALAGAGIPLLGLDSSQPSETAPLP